MSYGKHHAHMLRERAEYMRTAGHIDDAELDIECADEIERLTAERDAALAKVAQYEQATVVGWGVLIGSWVEFATSRRAADEIAEPYDNVTVAALIARPEVTK